MLELLKDDRALAYLAVAQGTEMAVSETLELEEALRTSSSERTLDAVIVNASAARRFTPAELERARAHGRRQWQVPGRGERTRVVHAAAGCGALDPGARAPPAQSARAACGAADFQMFSVPFAFTAQDATRRRSATCADSPGPLASGVSVAVASEPAGQRSGGARRLDLR